MVLPSYEKLRAACITLLAECSGASEAWLAEAESLLLHTADAIDTVSSFDMSSLTEPAYGFAVDPGWGQGAVGAVTNGDGRGEAKLLESLRQTPTAVSGDPASWTIIEAAHALRRGDLSPVELVEACLARIDSTEGDVQAWVDVVAEQALAEARRAERELRSGNDRGLLHGIPFGVKDNIFTEGIRTSGGSRLFEHYVPAYDATVVRLLKQAGAIALGKTTTTEMALGDSPPTRNPWNLAHTPGGSSSGSAAAVAADQVPFALGTQTGGSLNRPTGYCGLVAVKPTFGRVSRHGVFPVAWTLDHVGAMTKTAIDQAVVLQSICRADERDPSTFAAVPPLARAGSDWSADAVKSLRGKKIGRPDRYFFTDLAPAQRAAYDEALRVLEREFGMIVVEFELPASFEAAVAAHPIIMQCEVAAVHGAALRERGHLMRPTLRARVLCGASTSAAVYVRAQQIRNLYKEQMRQVFHASVDFIATPTTPTPALEGLDDTGTPAFILPFTLTGFPTVVFPVGFEAASNLPLSIQFAAPPMQEELLLDLAIAYQHVTDWHTRRPLA